MHDNHFDRAVLQGFLQGELRPDTSREVVRHLLRGCPKCREITSHLWESRQVPEAKERPDLYSEEMVATFREKEAMLTVEREQAPQSFEELMRHPVGRQLILVRNSRRYATWGFCEHLMEMTWESRFDDADRTLDLAQLAIAVAERLDPQRYGEELVQDLAARAWAFMSNAHRIDADYPAAQAAFDRAEKALEQGTGDPLERARILELKAHLETDKGQYRDALQTFDRVMVIYLRAGDEHSSGTVLTQKGLVFGRSGDLRTAIRLIRQGLELMDPDWDLRQFLAARHNLISYLHRTGQWKEALSLLRETRPLYRRLGDRLQLLRLRWLEGRIAMSLGHLTVAEAALGEARDGFIEQKLGYDASQVSLDLALLYSRQGRANEMCQLAIQMVPIFDARDMHQEALAAILVFQKAVEDEAASLELIQGMIDYLEQARNDPNLQFQPPE